MRTYYYLARIYISHQRHVRNRANLDKSWHNLTFFKRKLRVLQMEKIEKIDKNRSDK